MLEYAFILIIYCNFVHESIIFAMTKDINRLKIVLAEQKRTNKWLAQQLKRDQATVSKWCTNTAQPGLETLVEISDVLEVDVRELLHSTRRKTQPE